MTHFAKIGLQSHRVFRSALGWFDLGNYVEAFNELDNLPPEHRASVEAMELRCRIYRKLEKWRELEMVAHGSFEGSNEILFLCHWCWALMKQGQSEQAETIVNKHADFRTKNDAEFSYTAACVLWSLGRPEAKSLLSRAIELSQDSKAMKLRALEQPELESIWRSDTDHRPECN